MSQLRLRLMVGIVVLLALTGAGNALAAGNVVISQVYGGGGNSGATLRNDYIELFNRGTTPVNISGWAVQYASSAGNTWQLSVLSGTLQPGQYYLVQEAQGTGGTVDLPTPDATGLPPIAMSATSAKVALTNNLIVLTCGQTVNNCFPNAAIEDFVGYGSTANNFEGSGPTATLSNTTAALRAGSGCTDTDANSADFAVGAPLPRNTASPLAPCGGPPPNQPVTATCGGALSTLEGTAASRVVTASDPDGTVTGFSASVTGSPAPGTIGITSQTPAGSVGGTASATISVSANVAPGTYTVQVTASNNDSTPQTGTCSFTVTVEEIKSIGEVQGVVDNLAIGNRHASPFRNQVVFVRGVIYEKTVARDSRTGNSINGFFLQSSLQTADGDPLTSDGIFVHMSTFTDLIGGYVPQVGDEVVLRATVQEDFNLTRLASASLVERVGTALDLDTVLGSAPAVDPPTLLADADRYWERLEGMRVRVPAGSIATDGLDVFAGSFDSEMWLMRSDSPVAGRSDPYAARVFRDAHPLDNLPTPLFDDGNGYRIMVASFGVKASSGSNLTTLTPSRTFDRTTNYLVGGVYFAFSKYSVQTINQPNLVHGVDPALNAPPTAGNRHVEYSVGDYNVENLYDYRDDPNDGCDFVGNLGCPGVSPPFDYVPASEAVYQERLGLIAQQIVGDLHAPDILLVQEAEDQDICEVVAGALACGTADDADGKPDTLQELALRIEAQSGIAYDAAYDRDGSDDRGIVAALLYRTDRVELLPASADHPVLGSSPEVEYVTPGNAYNQDIQNPKSLNAPLPPEILALPPNQRDGVEVYTRDPQVGLFRVWRTAVGVGAWVDVYAISNHFSSTPDGRVAQRREQARYLANIVDALGDGVRVVAGGDFNVFPRPDDPLQPPSDQLGPLYDQGLENLWDTLVAEVPAAAYSYVFIGQAQTLDGQFVSDNLLAELEQTRVAHVNADFAADFPGDGARGLSDHDPLASRFALEATLERLEALLALYCENGAITGNNTCEQLQSHLDRVPNVGDDQLLAFIGQVRDKTPRFITQQAADALVAEVLLLLNG